MCTQFTARVMFVSKRSFKGTQPHSTLSRHSCIAHDVKKSFRDVELLVLSMRQVLIFC